MKLSKSARYALLAAAEMARSRNDDPITVGLVAKRHMIPENALAKVFQRLVHSGLAVGTRGVHGGYRLVRRPAEITVLDVLEVFEPAGQPRAVVNGRPGPPEAPPTVPDPLGRLFDDADEQLRSCLGALTLEALADGETAGLRTP